MSEATNLEPMFPSKGQAGADPNSIPLEKIDVTDSELWLTEGAFAEAVRHRKVLGGLIVDFELRYHNPLIDSARRLVVEHRIARGLDLDVGERGRAVRIASSWPEVDDYLDGVIDAETFAKLTFSTDWAGEGTWAAWYQPIVDAALGGELEVPTLDGRVKLKIPPETQTGKVFRLRGKGVTPVRGGGIGDLLCKVNVETPVNLSDDQKDLLGQFKASLGEGGGRHSPRETSWFQGVKDFFDGLTS